MTDAVAFAIAPQYAVVFDIALVNDARVQPTSLCYIARYDAASAELRAIRTGRYVSFDGDVTIEMSDTIEDAKRRVKTRSARVREIRITKL